MIGITFLEKGNSGRKFFLSGSIMGNKIKIDWFEHLENKLNKITKGSNNIDFIISEASKLLKHYYSCLEVERTDYV